METQLVYNMEQLEKLIRNRMDNYEAKLWKATSGSVSATPDISSLSREFSDFKTFIWQSLSTMNSQIELLTLGLDRHENALRRKVLLLHGVPEIPNEKTREVALKIISHQLKHSDILAEHLQVCHRLGSLHTKARPILVRFHNMEHRYLVWNNKTELKGTGIIVTEFLTKSRRKVFMAARKHFGSQQCWTVEGKINILLPDNTREKIETMKDLGILIIRYPTGVVEDSKDLASTKTAFNFIPKYTKKGLRRN